MENNVTEEELKRFKILYENYKDKIDEVLELARLYERCVIKKENEGQHGR